MGVCLRRDEGKARTERITKEESQLGADVKTTLDAMGGRLYSRRACVGSKNETWGQLQADHNLFIDIDSVSA